MNTVSATFVHFNVHIDSLIHGATFELPLCENCQSLVPGTFWDAEMNATLYFLKEQMQSNSKTRLQAEKDTFRREEHVSVIPES